MLGLQIQLQRSVQPDAHVRRAFPAASVATPILVFSDSVVVSRPSLDRQQTVAPGERSSALTFGIANTRLVKKRDRLANLRVTRCDPALFADLNTLSVGGATIRRLLPPEADG